VRACFATVNAPLLVAMVRRRVNISD